MSRTINRMSPYRVWGSIDDGTVEFESLTKDTLDGAMNVIRECFFVRESVCRGVDLISEHGAAEELEELCFNAAKDGVSVVAVDLDAGEVVAVAFNKIQVCNGAEKSAFEVFSENCKHKSSKALVDLMIDVDNRIDLFKHYNTDCVLEIMFMATMPDKQKRRIGESLVISSVEIAKELKKGNNVKIPVTINGDNGIQNLNAIPSLVSAIMTSSYSQKIAAKCGFEKLLTVSYEEFQHNGKVLRDRIGDEHPCCALVAKRLF